MSYIIVRTQDKLSETVQQFQQQNIDAVGLCVLDVQYMDFEFPNIQEHQGFIFTSQYGIKGLCQNFAPSPLHHAFCIGESTAQIAKQSGFQHIHVPNNAQSDALTEILKGFSLPLLYCTGKYRKPYLEENLNRLNISFQTLETYTTTPIKELSQETKALLETDTHHLICFSIRNAKALHQLLKENNIHKKHIWHIVGKKIELEVINSHFYDTPNSLYNELLNI